MGNSKIFGGAMFNRREILKLAAASSLLPLLTPLVQACDDKNVILKSIPSSKELLPAIGMGSYQTFNIEKNSERKAALIEVLKLFFAAKGSLIDSSPMYGKSEMAIGDLITELSPIPKYFSASKVWTYGQQEGIDAINESMRRMQVKQMDLMQVHNLRDWKIQLPTLQNMKEKTIIRYTGITTSRLSQYDDFEHVMKTQQLDFVQLNYNIEVREAEKRLLPLAMDRGQAVIVNMPFEKGRLFKKVKSESLPPWAKEIDCNSWAQVFLKFIISHPAVTCAIPATSKVKHMADNMQAITGALPDVKMRKTMVNYFEML